ncbi:hypothetical protein J6590_087514 [Homalodisca vitripennis]|nr:hypothetical protein J6590_087514 [Homalodisca vitripennis]
MNDKGWTVQKRLLSARRASQMAVFDNEIESLDIKKFCQLIGISFWSRLLLTACAIGEGKPTRCYCIESRALNNIFHSPEENRTLARSVIFS